MIYHAKDGEGGIILVARLEHGGFSPASIQTQNAVFLVKCVRSLNLPHHARYVMYYTPHQA